METPSSTTRRMTRSQTLASMSNTASSKTNISRKMEDTNKGMSQTKETNLKQDRSVLIDITNDSPIVGLASGRLKTPVSSMARQRSNHCKRTPGSGEALLRCQVKTLLQKVEEEAEISKFSVESGNLKAFLNSPAGLLAPTPANTPQLLNFSSAVDEFESFGSVSQSPIEDLLTISQVMNGNFESGSQSEKDMVSRTLFMDFSEKSDSSSECSSVVTYQGTVGSIETESEEKSVTMEDDDASVWSIQVNASTRDEDEDENEAIDDDVVADNDDYDDDGEYVEVGEDEDNDLDCLDELCEEMSKISVNGEKGAKFMGKHTRFVYDSDDELFEEHEECGVEEDSTEILRLKGLPTPKGKHLRFQEKEGDDE